MRWRGFRAYRNIAIFVVALLCCLLLPSVVRNSVLNLFDEFRAPIDAIPSHLNDLQKYWSLTSNSKRELIEAGRDLARLNAANTQKIIENEELKMEVSRLEKMYNMPSFDKFKCEVARVIRRDIGTWQQQITIRKGSLHGIKEGYAVVFSGGVVGKISSVTLYTADVMLLGSRNFRMAAHFENDERAIIYQGGGSKMIRSANGEVSDVPEDVKASPSAPLKLLTSSLTGTFPDGIYIGKVSALTQEADGIFKSGEVELSSELSSLREVGVLIPVSNLE